MESIVSEIRSTVLKESDHGTEATPKVNAEGGQVGPGVVVLKGNLCYIVAATILDEDGRVLMMREAKASCRGKWYLPAGRMERGESIEDAVVRETLEETGLRIQPTALLCIESHAMNWFRFTFAGNVVGGTLKSEKQQDKESIEAGWFHPKEIMSKLDMRATDVFPLIKTAIKWYETHKKTILCRCLPVKIAHSNMSVSLVLINEHNHEAGSSLDVLAFKTSDHATPSLPIWVVDGLGIEITMIVNKLVERALPGHIRYTVHGYLQLQHDTQASHKGADGLHLTVLAKVMAHKNDLQEHYMWLPLAGASQTLSEKLVELINGEGYVKLISH